MSRSAVWRFISKVDIVVGPEFAVPVRVFGSLIFDAQIGHELPSAILIPEEAEETCDNDSFRFHEDLSAFGTAETASSLIQYCGVR